jgi:hypothetical protein
MKRRTARMKVNMRSEMVREEGYNKERRSSAKT